VDRVLLLQIVQELARLGEEANSAGLPVVAQQFQTALAGAKQELRMSGIDGSNQASFQARTVLPRGAVIGPAMALICGSEEEVVLEGTAHS